MKSVCVITSCEESAVLATASRLLSSAIYKIYRPNVFNEFSNETALGDQAYVLEQHRKDLDLLKATCNQSILDLAQALDQSEDDYTRQLEFMHSVRSGVLTYAFEPVPKSSKRVICKLTGRRLKTRNAVAFCVWQPNNMRPVKRRFASARKEAEAVLAKRGDVAFVEFVDKNLDQMLQEPKRYFIARKRLKFVKAFLNVCLIDLFINAQAVKWVEECGGDVEDAVEKLSQTQEPAQAFIKTLRLSHERLGETTRKIEMN
ncbi:MAG: hypothetical protein CMP20_02765 [Rickettsiales bacterium]|nr:hypothetical protein [Rickettsiales bacterium]